MNKGNKAPSALQVWFLLFLCQKNSVSIFLFLVLGVSPIFLADQYLFVFILRRLGTYHSLALHAATGLCAVFFLRNTIIWHTDILLGRKKGRGKSHITHIAKIFLYFVSCLLFLIPGILSDMLGTLILLPPLRHLAIYLFIQYNRASLNHMNEYLTLLSVNGEISEPSSKKPAETTEE